MAQRRRAYGSGSLYAENGVYYGRWYTEAGGYANRRVGPVRKPGSTEGFTKKQAEAKLREIMDGAGGRLITTPPGPSTALAGCSPPSCPARAARFRTWRRSTATYASTSRPSSRRRRSTGSASRTSTGS